MGTSDLTFDKLLYYISLRLQRDSIYTTETIEAKECMK